MQKEAIAWVTGAGGLIGNYLVQTAPRFAPGWRARGLTRATLDLLEFESARRAFLADRPRLVIHCAAISSTNSAQANPSLARRVNIEATALLAELAADIPFIFLSSDLVFDGLKGSYVESDATNPITLYAETKLAAEQLVLANPRHAVVRTSINGGISPTGDRAFNEQIRRAWESGQVLRLFTDEYRSPIPAAVTARALWELGLSAHGGLFHVAGAARLSRWEIGRLLAGRWPRLEAKMEPASLRGYPGPPRSPDTSLLSAKAQKLLSFRLPGLDEWLAENPDERF